VVPVDVMQGYRLIADDAAVFMVVSGGAPTHA
jgi:hypothetical protein